MCFEFDAADAFRCLGDGVFCQFAAHGTPPLGNETKVAEGDLPAHVFSAAQEQIKLVHASMIKFGEPLFAFFCHFFVGAHKDALLPECELAASCGEQRVLIPIGEEKSREKCLFCAVKEIDHSSPVSAEYAADGSGRAGESNKDICCAAFADGLT